MPRSCNFILTINNPDEDIHQTLERAKANGCKAAALQLEKGEAGNLHIQAFIRYESQRTCKSVSKTFPTAHIEVAKHAFKAWEYCTKEDTRVEGPVTFGEMPKPPKAKSNYTDYNAAVLANLESMVSDGRVNIKEYPKLKQAQQLF